MCSSAPDPEMWIIQGTLAWRTPPIQIEARNQNSHQEDRWGDPGEIQCRSNFLFSRGIRVAVPPDNMSCYVDFDPGKRQAFGSKPDFCPNEVLGAHRDLRCAVSQYFAYDSPAFLLLISCCWISSGPVRNTFVNSSRVQMSDEQSPSMADHIENPPLKGWDEHLVVRPQHFAAPAVPHAPVVPERPLVPQYQLLNQRMIPAAQKPQANL
ncbi:hypothetical protein Syun_007319 [Stephania yunnanensis]|uniref:Uncharacterized protein n=1 Tax=Stephania yunnanensis TaxID=152371 RepID=A0AAP0KYA5_9MAGN